jgi:nicotinate-nucleotide pyrophosphorylase (carboxylating)
MKLAMDDFILSALKEDVNSEDVTTNAIIEDGVLGEVDLICKEDSVLSGIDVFARAFTLLDENVGFEIFFADGENVKDGDLVAKIRGDIKTLLMGERTALNYLQRMSGVASYTAEIVRLLDGTGIKLLDTRKTTPNNRIFEKYAVKIGGGTNHRYNLSDGVLLKDNHIGAAGSVKKAIEMAKQYAPFVRKIEVECENFEMVKAAVETGADIIMLDNMDSDNLKRCIRAIRENEKTANSHIDIEISGNVTRENIAGLKGMGVDYISSGALTHSAPIKDFSLKNLKRIQ